MRHVLRHLVSLTKSIRILVKQIHYITEKGSVASYQGKGNQLAMRAKRTSWL